MSTASSDRWAVGEAYEPYVGRWSRLVAREFLSWLTVAPRARWLDVGCGTGALTDVILREADPSNVHAVDPSAAFLEFARHRIPDRRATFVVGDARSMPCATQTFDAVVSGLAINFVPQPSLAVTEMTRVARTGGVVAAYVWDYAERMQLMRYFWDAVVALDPRASELDEARRFHVCHPTALETLFRDARLREVESVAVEVRTRFRDFDDYWRPFLGGQGPAPGYAMSLTEDRRSALRERLLATLPIAADGSIDLVARAWAVRGTRA